jgi:hypothetical protein
MSSRQVEGNTWIQRTLGESLESLHRLNQVDNVTTAKRHQEEVIFCSKALTCQELQNEIPNCRQMMWNESDGALFAVFKPASKSAGGHQVTPS